MRFEDLTPGKALLLAVTALVGICVLGHDGLLYDLGAGEGERNNIHRAGRVPGLQLVHSMTWARRPARNISFLHASRAPLHCDFGNFVSRAKLPLTTSRYINLLWRHPTQTALPVTANKSFFTTKGRTTIEESTVPYFSQVRIITLALPTECSTPSREISTTTTKLILASCKAHHYRSET
jgi:hypothetical protein